MKTLPYLALFALLLTTCSKEQVETLPPATQVGANTFGCKVNGKNWIPNGGPGFGGPKPIEGGFVVRIISGNAGNPQERVVINVNAYKKNGEIINLYINKRQTGYYQFNSITAILPYSNYPPNYGAFANSQGWFITNDKSTGEINITRCDTVNAILSGTFSFKAALHSDPSQRVEVTDGRFDINLRTL